MKKNNKVDTKRIIKNSVDSFKARMYKSLDWLVNKNRFIGYLVTAIVIIISILSGVVTFLEPVKKVYDWFVPNKVLLPSPIPQPVLSANDDEDPIMRRANDQKYEDRCNGAEFDILSDSLLPVGGERFTYEEEEDVVSVRETEGYQAVVITPWGCKLPFEAKARIYPVYGPSLGLILEYESVFRVLIGDGDRKTIRVQQNKWNIRGGWPDVPMENNRLAFQIEDEEEVLVIVKAKVVNDEVLVQVEILHSKYQSIEKFNVYFKPTGVNFTQDELRKFRIGMNDSFYQGNGSAIKMDTFSVKEGSWE